ncbi:MAG TPA: molybdopterin biosynthesis protein [Roseiflexaceae bacterium]|nr:molybdopterin biosynthesis protein [Roseiflexaceae bacterium]
MARRYYLEDLPLDEAWRRFEEALARAGSLRLPEPERVPLSEACGRITAVPAWAALSSPHYHAAAMDGVAVRAADTLGASETAPLRLALGAQAAWVDTGDPLPPGADAVIMAEHVQTVDDATVEIMAPVAPWQHVRPLGEDIVATELVLPENHLIRPVDVGALAAAGLAEVTVRRRPRVAIIPTGTELVSLGAGDQRPTTNHRRPTTNDQPPTTGDRGPTTGDQPPTTDDRRPATDGKRPTANDRRSAATDQLALGNGDVFASDAGGHSSFVVRRSSDLRPGQIIEFNSLVLAGYVAEWGGVATRLPPVPDSRELVRAAVARALDGHDIVVVNAGSSAGAEDYTAAVLAELGEVAVHGVAIRPGHPVILAVAGGVPVLGLPGYPVSTAITADLFLRPLVYRLQGRAPPRRPTLQATISRKLLSPMGEDEFVRVTLGRVDERTVATPLARGAGVITSLVRADGLVRIPRFSEGLHAGAQVEVELLRDPSEVAGTIVAVGSHDLALDLLASHVRRFAPAARLVSANVGSLGGLLALKRGDAHLAGTHLLDEERGEYNWPFVERLLPGQDIVLVNLAYRDQGLIVAPGNPQGLHDLADLTRPDVRFVNRQRGAGTRVLLDFHLKQRGISPEQIAGYEREEFTHMAVAAAVLSGAATAGLGILAAARALGLEFVPLFTERYDLAVQRRHWESELLAPLRQALASQEYRQAVSALGGYDVREMGRIITPQGRG